METEILSIAADEQPESVRQKLSHAGDIIKNGGLVAFPTETVYGLGGDALNPESARKIYAAKGRPSDNPLIVHIADMEALDAIAKRIPEKARQLARAFWPGPLTMIMEKTGLVPAQTTGGLDTVAVRMPGHPAALALIRAAGGYVAAPSANLSGKPSPTTAKYVIQDMAGRIELILDADGAELGLESTIVDLTGEVPVILRPGYITQEMIARTVGETEMDITLLDGDSTQAPKAPGMKYRHYAPKGELALVEGSPEAVVQYINEQARRHRGDNKKTGVIGTAERIADYCADSVKNAGSRRNPLAAARQLYTFLREFDDEEVAYIYSEAFEGAGIEQALMNRLLKAAGHKVIQV